MRVCVCVCVCGGEDVQLTAWSVHVRAENKLVRKELAKASLFTQPPTPDEQKLLHTLFMDRIAGKQVSGAPTRARVVVLLLSHTRASHLHAARTRACRDANVCFAHPVGAAVPTAGAEPAQQNLRWLPHAKGPRTRYLYLFILVFI